MLHEFEQECKKSIEHMYHEFKTVRSGRVTADLLDGVKVEVYGAMTPLVGVASVSVQDAKTIFIQPWDKNNIKAIEKAIQTSDIGVNPVSDGVNIRLMFPDLTEEKRKEFVKQIHAIGEKAKVTMRNARHKVIDEIKKSELSEDQERSFISDADDMVKKYNTEVDGIIKQKEKDLMSL